MLDEIMEQYYILSESDAIQVNRLFLEMIYPDFCPPIFEPSEGFVQAVPLASIIIGDNEETGNLEENNIRATTITAYNTQKSTIDNAFSKYKVIYTKDLNISPQSGITITFDNSKLKLGIKGTFTNTWGNIGSSIEGVVYITGNTQIITTTGSFNKSIYSYELSSSYPVFAYGPIVLSITARFGINIPLTVTASVSAPVNVNASFTGLYGAGVEVGLNYGITTKKIWIIRIPVPYCSTYGNGWKISNTAYYIGTNSGNLSAAASVTITPSAQISIGADISKVVGADLGYEIGLRNNFTVSYVRPTLTGLATITLRSGIYAQPWIGFDVPIIGRIGFKKKIDLWNAEQQLAKWEVFKKTIS
jgi:hypothetical protein